MLVKTVSIHFLGYSSTYMLRTRTLFSWVIFIGAIFVMVVPLPGDDDSHLMSISEANDETLVILTTDDPALLTPIVDHFADEYDADVRVEVVDSTIDADVLRQTQADLVLVRDINELVPVIDADALDTLPPDILWNIDPHFRDVSNRWIGYTGRLQVLVYNPDLVDVSQLPTTVTGLVSSNWVEHIGCSSESVMNPLGAGYRDLLMAVTQRGGHFETDAEVIQAIEDGELAIGIVNHDSVDLAAMDNSTMQLGIHVLADDRGSAMTVSAIALADSANSKPLAELFLIHLYGMRTQNLIAETTGQYTFLAFSIATPQDLPILTDLSFADFGTLFDSNHISSENRDSTANTVASTN
jgi:iron(III) transport system substrate-binding protein